jgi:NAD(P)-dependent dehydrogenase (short-subunit alcohol dehydrogenase family)
MSQTITLITGANKGIGFETARQLGAAGQHVIIGARDAAKGEAAAASLREAGYSVEAVQLDVTNAASIKAAAETITAKHGHLDVLVNNAGINIEFGGTAPDTLTVDQLRETFETNVFGAFSVLQAFAPLLEKAKGRVINVSSKLGSLTLQSDPTSDYYPFVMPAYNASKAALNGLTIAYSKAYAPKGISVASICPGWVKTDLGSDAAPREVDEGAGIIVKLATDATPSTGVYVDDDGTIGW